MAAGETSKRLKDTGTSQMKMGGQNQDKLSAEMESEGIHSNNQNSFAVLSNSHYFSCFQNGDSN